MLIEEFEHRSVLEFCFEGRKEMEMESFLCFKFFLRDGNGNGGLVIWW